MQRFKSARHAQQFLSAHGPIHGHFRPRRHRLAASDYRATRTEAFRAWREDPGLARGNVRPPQPLSEAAAPLLAQCRPRPVNVTMPGRARDGVVEDLADELVNGRGLGILLRHPQAGASAHEIAEQDA